VRLSGRHLNGIPLPFFRFKNNPMKFLISQKQVQFARGLFRQYGTKVWREWPTSALLHQDYLDLKDQVEPVQAVMDESFESGLFWYAALESKDLPESKKQIHLLVEGASAAEAWLSDISYSQGSHCPNTAMLLGYPTMQEVKTHPLLTDADGNILSKQSHSKSADSLVYGSLKLNDDVQYGMGAEVFRLWIASVDIEHPLSNTIICEERLLDLKREELNLVRKIYWQAASVIAKCRDNGMGDQKKGKYRPIHKFIESQFKFFGSTLVSSYESRDLSKVYAGFMDFSKYHFLDAALPFLADKSIKGDIPSLHLLSKVANFST
jgi:isoleucyl-tRNA synthetase